MEKYINFPQHPLFQPMLNPADILLSGAYGGSYLPESLQADFKKYYPRMPWDRITRIGKEEDPTHNAAWALADHKHTRDHDTFNAKGFMDWYISFYYAQPEDRIDPKNIICIQAPLWIYQWARHLFDVFDGKVKKDQVTSKPILTQEQHQRLIELAWNPDYFPPFKLDQFNKYAPINDSTEGSKQL